MTFGETAVKDPCDAVVQKGITQPFESFIVCHRRGVRSMSKTLTFEHFIIDTWERRRVVFRFDDGREFRE